MNDNPKLCSEEDQEPETEEGSEFWDTNSSGARKESNDNDTRSDDNDGIDHKDPSTITKAAPYKSRKPRWWTQCGQGRATKSQKKAMAALKDTHQLPRIPYGEYYDWHTVFNETTTLLAGSLPWIEIGCGTGENLLALAEKYPSQPLIGAEMHPSGNGKCFQRMYQAIQRNKFWHGHILYTINLEQECQNNRESQQNPYILEQGKQEDYNDESLYDDRVDAINNQHKVVVPYSNVRLFAGNGVTVLQKAPPASLALVLLTFPDPFPKQPDYRLLQNDVLDDIERALKPGEGRLVVATDHDGHAEWIQNQLQLRLDSSSGKCVWNVVESTTELRKTYLPAVSKYEGKGWHEGRTTKLLVFQLCRTDT